MDVTGLIALSLVFLAPTAIAIVAIISNYQETKKRYEALVKALETGKDPEKLKEIFAVEKKAKVRNGTGFLKGGIIVAGLALGLAAMAFFLPSGATSGTLAAFALIFVLGISLIAVFVVMRKQERKE